MATGFDYDPDETVSFEGHDVSLRTAVRRYREIRADPDPLLDAAAFRDPGKEPPVFEAEHFEALLEDPAFEEAQTAAGARGA
jgi:hypothetical protein